MMRLGRMCGAVMKCWATLRPSSTGLKPVGRSANEVPENPVVAPGVPCGCAGACCDRSKCAAGSIRRAETKERRLSIERISRHRILLDCIKRFRRDFVLHVIYQLGKGAG